MTDDPKARQHRLDQVRKAGRRARLLEPVAEREEPASEDPREVFRKYLEAEGEERSEPER
ncbi:MAG TPA: hypothetical protein VIA06_24190 [Candidatus Dormibacteraeota bacterium]|jgi:hypothetical protein|nr:hypothetical protein [Candidatus Dormibacteraeota bacterium]